MDYWAQTSPHIPQRVGNYGRGWRVHQASEVVACENRSNIACQGGRDLQQSKETPGGPVNCVSSV